MNTPSFLSLFTRQCSPPTCLGGSPLNSQQFISTSLVLGGTKQMQYCRCGLVSVKKSTCACCLSCFCSPPRCIHESGKIRYHHWHARVPWIPASITRADTLHFQPSSGSPMTVRSLDLLLVRKETSMFTSHHL